MNPPQSDPLIGAILQERYRVIERIADGAMGSVYRGERLQLGRQVAIKFLHPAVAEQATLRQRFSLEAKAMSRLSHPNCVSVIDFGVDTLPYLVMDFVAGENLRTILLRGPLGPERAIAITRQVLAGLAHAHAQGIVHRDIKPENVVLSQMPGLGEHVRLLDFGLAKLLDNDVGLTAGVALGTPSYMAPEQIGDGAIDARTDLYATAVLLFEMLTGRKPFAADNIGDLLLNHLEAPPPALRAVAPDAAFSPELEAVLVKAMAKDPQRRYANAQAMADALAGTREAAPPAGDEAGAFPPARDDMGRGAPPGGGRPLPGLTPPARTQTAPFGVPPPADPAEPAGLPPPGGDHTVLDQAIDQRMVEAAVAAPATMALAADDVIPLTPAPEAPSPPAGAAPSPTAVAAPNGTPARRRRQVMIAAGVVIVGLSATLWIAGRSNDGPAAIEASLAEAAALHLRGEVAAAIDRLAPLASKHPENTSLAAALSRLYFENQQRARGFALYETALARDRELGSDRVLVGHVIDSLRDRTLHPRATHLLRALGPRVHPQLEEAARGHESPLVRRRAARVLRPAGDGPHEPARPRRARGGRWHGAAARR